MTIISGLRIVTTPCCGRYYSLPNYRTMNFSAFEYWTDGWSDGALMPVGEGVRVCTCGSLFLNRECKFIKVVDSSNYPYPDWAGAEEFRENIREDIPLNLLLAIRLDLWRHLNHEYRHIYRNHRDNEEAEIKTEWLASNPDRRTWWDKLCRKQPPIYNRPDRAITFPRFEPSAEQIENMVELTELLSRQCQDERKTFLLVELFREQGRFEEAQRTMSLISSSSDPNLKKVLRLSLEQCQTMPIRFRY
jgi:hypothetical protein